MRAFAEGYYTNLIRMYKYLDIEYSSQLFNYSFERKSAPDSTSGNRWSCYFVYSSNNHRVPPIRPDDMDFLPWLIEIIYVSFWYFWWTVCCFIVHPRMASSRQECETLHGYVHRIGLPIYFLRFYLLPLLSSVATCSHACLLDFPAIDLTEYKKRSARGNHYTVSSVHEVQKRLVAGLKANLSATVINVERTQDHRLKVSWSTVDGIIHHDQYDHVILAVAPNIASGLFEPLSQLSKRIPTTVVESFVQGNGIDVLRAGFPLSQKKHMVIRSAQTIHFRTSSERHRTESIHVHPSGARVVTCALDDKIYSSDILQSAKFFRAVRTPDSRRFVSSIFDEKPSVSLVREKEFCWKNGNDNVWLVGGWCWDGMVLLEGCVVSAMRVARALNVDIPW